MATAEKSLVRDVMRQPENVISADETLEVANRVMSGQTVRSLIVIDENQVMVGVVFIHDVRQADPETPIRSVMDSQCPILRPDTTLGEARSALGEFDYDLLPVVDDQGLIVGEVPRQDIVHADHGVASGGEGVDFDLQQSGGSTTRATIRSGMEVVGANGNKLGTVDEVMLEGDRPTAFTVKHGLVGRKHKQLAMDIIDRIDNDTVALRIDKTEFKFLANIEDQE